MLSVWLYLSLCIRVIIRMSRTYLSLPGYGKRKCLRALGLYCMLLRPFVLIQTSRVDETFRPPRCSIFNVSATSVSTDPRHAYSHYVLLRHIRLECISSPLSHHIPSPPHPHHPEYPKHRSLTQAPRPFLLCPHHPLTHPGSVPLRHLLLQPPPPTTSSPLVHLVSLTSSRGDEQSKHACMRVWAEGLHTLGLLGRRQ